MILPLGGLTVAGLNPKLALAISALLALKADLDTQLKGSLALNAALTAPTFDIAATISAVAAVLAQLQAGITPPGLSLSAAAQFTADLNAKLALILPFLTIQLGAGGLYAYAFSGPTNQFGPEIGSTLASGLPGAGPATPADGLAIVTTIRPAWEALGKVLKVA